MTVAPTKANLDRLLKEAAQRRANVSVRVYEHPEGRAGFVALSRHDRSEKHVRSWSVVEEFEEGNSHARHQNLASAVATVLERLDTGREPEWIADNPYEQTTTGGTDG